MDEDQFGKTSQRQREARCARQSPLSIVRFTIGADAYNGWALVQEIRLIEQDPLQHLRVPALNPVRRVVSA